MDNDDLFDDYLDQKLSPEARNNFNQRIKKDEQFAQSFTEYIEIKLAAQIASELEEPEEQGKSFWMNKIKILIFVLFLLGVFTFVYFWDSYRPKSIGHLFNEPIALVERGRADNFYSNITENYNEENYNLTLRYIDSALIAESNNPKLQLYKGICLRDKNSNPNYEEAIQIFQGIKNNRETQTAEYHLALTYYKMNDLENAREILNEILENNKHAKYKQAEEFMENGF